MSRRPIPPEEVAEILRLFREEHLSYKQIGKRLGRNHSTVGYVVRREDLREEARLLKEEAACPCLKCDPPGGVGMCQRPADCMGMKRLVTPTSS